jgi:hypothetical protein
VALTQPSNFLWRVFFNAGAGKKGALRASQKFVEFLTFTWLQAIRASDPRYSGDQPLFLPEMLFKSPAEVSAYWLHIE